MDSLIIFKSYIDRRIEEIKKEYSKTDYLNKISNILSTLYSLLRNKEFEKINFEELKEALFFVYTDENIDDKISKTKEAISIITLFGDADIPQIKLVNDYLEKMANSILSAKESIESTIDKTKKEYHSQLSEYEKYQDLVDKDRINRHLNEEELKKFFEFLNKSLLEKEIILKLTELFAKDSIEYVIRTQHMKDVKIQSQLEKNASRVKRTFQARNKENISSSSQVIYSLTEDESKIYNQILSIIKVLEEDIVLTHDSLVDILRDDYSLDSRVKVYDSSDDKFNLVLGDLKKNLLPNFEKNKKKILSIFNYIVQIYDSEYGKEKEKFVSTIPDFTKEELSEIEKYLKIFNEELKKYNSLSDIDKNMFHSIIELINAGEDAEISNKFSLEYVKKFILLKRLNELFNEYHDYRNDEEEHFKLDLYDEFTASITQLMNDIKNTINKLNEELNKKIGNPEKPKQYTSERKTIFIFLPLGNDEYSICEDQEEILKNKRQVMKNVADGLYTFSRTDFYTFKKDMADRIKNIEPTENVISYKDEINPYRFRKGEARIAYIKVPVTAKNQEKIKEAYDTSRADIVLIIGCSSKLDGSSYTYSEFNRRIAKEIYNIRYIINLFSHDFDEATFRQAATLIDDADKICEQLYKDPTKLLRNKKSREEL